MNNLEHPSIDSHIAGVETPHISEIGELSEYIVAESVLTSPIPGVDTSHILDSDALSRVQPGLDSIDSPIAGVEILAALSSPRSLVVCQSVGRSVCLSVNLYKKISQDLGKAALNTSHQLLRCQVVFTKIFHNNYYCHYCHCYYYYNLSF